jgi:hypothetical protein
MFYNIPKEIIYPIITHISKPNHDDFSIGEFSFLFCESITTSEYYSSYESTRLYFNKEGIFNHLCEFVSEDSCMGSTDRSKTTESGSFKVISDGNIDKIDCDGIVVDNNKQVVTKRSFEIQFQFRKDLECSQKRNLIGVEFFLKDTKRSERTYRLYEP